jgi:hypothetical protein
MPAIEPRRLGCPASSLVTVPTTLARQWPTEINTNTGTLFDITRENCMEASTEKTDFTSSAFCSISQQVATCRFSIQHFIPLRTDGLVCE